MRLCRLGKELISNEPYESAAFIDVDGDGVLDIVSGAWWWYKGPDFRQKYHVANIMPAGEWYDDFSTIALDINGNGRPDVVTGGWFGGKLRWFENPGEAGKDWPEHIIAETGPIETTRAWDLDSDGVIETVPNTPCGPLIVYKLCIDEQGRGTGEFRKIQIGSENQGHGLGAADIAGNGRMDLVVRSGWFEAPENPWDEKWIWHPDFDLMKSSSVPIIGADVTGNGLSDLIVGGAHEYGLDWWEQRLVDGKREWTRHPIDPFNSQYHDMKWIDIDGDGECELLTGQRWRAHNGNDPGAWDEYGICYFKWNGESFSEQTICHGPAGETTGLGICFAADLNGNGLPDILTPGKDSLWIFRNQ